MLLSEKPEEDEPKQRYVLGNEYIGLISETKKESAARYYVTDEQGSVRYVLKDNSEVESYYQYDAFGETIIQEGNQSRLQYNSQIWDEVSGLYYLRARYYNPRTGRFTQEDVIYNDGLNLYVYCNSNPVIYSDPSGFAKQQDLLTSLDSLSYDQKKKELYKRYKEYVNNKVSNKKFKISPDGLLNQELKVSSYNNMPTKPGDCLTPHHMPAADSIQRNNIGYGDGTCLNVREDTHRLTFTYGMGNSGSRAYDYALYNSLSYEDRLIFDQQNIRDAYRMQRPNVDLDEVDKALKKEYKEAMENYKNNQCQKK